MVSCVHASGSIDTDGFADPGKLVYLDMLRNQGSLVRRLLTAIISVALFVTAVELMVRATDIDTSFQNRFFVVNRALDYPDVFLKDRDLLWRFRLNQMITSQFFEGQTYRINSLGFRGDEPDAIKSRPRILIIGNSCSFGWGVADSLTYAVRLEQRFHSDYEVINAAIPGYSSEQGKRWLRSLLHLEPDIIIALFVWNDHWAAANGIPDADQQFPPEWVIDLQNGLSRLHSYRLLKKALLSAVDTNPDSLFDRSHIVYRVGPDQYAANLQEIVAMGDSVGARTLLLTSPIPSLEAYYPAHRRSPMHGFHYGYNDVTRYVANISSADLIDIAKRFDDFDDLFDDAATDPIHFNARGHAVAAEMIYEFLSSDSAEATAE